MNFPDTLLPAAILWPANLAAALLLVYCLRGAKWQRLSAPGIQHLWFASCVVLMLLWNIRTGIKPGLNFHVLGATLLTLMFGPRLALIALSIVLGGISLASGGLWQSFGLNFLMMAALPVLFCYFVYSLAFYKLPRHVFVYIFLNGFTVAWVSMGLLGLADGLVLSLGGAYSFEYLRDSYLPFFILMGWSEALLTGMSVALMVAYRPEWLVTFSDRLYVKGK